MHFHSQPAHFEHALDIFSLALRLQSEGKSCALAFVISTVGGSVRRPGAVMAVTSEAKSYGYVSGGCIDADIKLRAAQAAKTGIGGTVLYGLESPYPDLKLPCGGAITIQIVPGPNADVLENIVADLRRARPATLYICEYNGLTLTATHTGPGFTYYPKPALRIAGRGYDALVLANIAAASGMDVILQTSEPSDADMHGDVEHCRLTSPAQIPENSDHSYTAFVLMFHDRDWDAPLLSQALNGPAFFVGAVGSKTTHKARVQALLSAGTPQNLINSIHAPIGLIPAMRDASALAISILAQIVTAYYKSADDQEL